MHRPVVTHRGRLVARRGRIREAIALAVLDELVVGHAPLVHLRALLAHLRLGTLALGLGFGHLRLLLGHLGLAIALRGLGAMPVGGTLTAVLELTLRPLLAARSHEGERRNGD